MNITEIDGVKIDECVIENLRILQTSEMVHSENLDRTIDIILKLWSQEIVKPEMVLDVITDLNDLRGMIKGLSNFKPKEKENGKK